MVADATYAVMIAPISTIITSWRVMNEHERG